MRSSSSANARGHKPNVPVAEEHPDAGIDVVLVDDHELVREVLGSWIQQQPGLRLVGQAGTAEAGLELCLRLQPGLVLLDIELPGMDGLELAAKLRVRLPRAKLLALTGKRDPYTVWRVLQGDLDAFVDKEQPLSVLLAAVRAVNAGQGYYSPIFLRIQTEWLHKPEAFQKILSQREQEIIQWVAAGALDPEIAAGLKIRVATVHAHRRNIRQKLAAHNDRELVAYARSWGLQLGHQIAGKPPQGRLNPRA